MIILEELIGKKLTDEERRAVIQAYKSAVSAHLAAVKCSSYWSNKMDEIYKNWSEQFTIAEKRELIIYLSSEKALLGAVIHAELEEREKAKNEKVIS
jgi:hypothetical protein